MVRKVHHGVAHDHELEVRRVPFLVRDEVVVDLERALAGIDPADVEQEGSVAEAVSLTEAGTVALEVEVRPDADHLLDRPVAEAAVDQVGLLDGEEAVAVGEPEDLVEEGDRQVRLDVGGGLEEGGCPPGDGGKAEDRRVVEVGEEDHDVEVGRPVGEPPGQLDRPRAHLRRPALLRCEGCRLAAPHDGGVECAEPLADPWPVHGMQVDEDVVDPLGSGGELVFPVGVVAGTTGRHLDLVATGGQVLGEQPATLFGPTGDVLSVALDDEQGAHQTTPASASRKEAVAAASSKSRSRWRPR